MRVDWNAVEKKWRDRWQKERQFEADAGAMPKKFITVAYPYPNSPQHVGHGRTYTIADVHARFMRMRGYAVLFPMGFHYTGTPILGMAKKIEAGDEDILRGLREIYGVPEDAIDTFVEPVKIADYFHEEIKAGMIEMGYSIDWRGEFTTIDPGYQKFVEWHISLLREAGLIVQGSHPVGWCPKDQNPVSQHDTMGDVEPEFTEYVLVKFEWNGHVIPTATLRPETIFGVTNLWANPGIAYKKALVDGQKWIISAECAEKLAFQDKKVEIIGEIEGREMAGSMARHPHSGMQVPILEAEFVDSGVGTGLVMSVPAHAPFDYQALADFKARQPPDSPHHAIEPVQIISTPGYGRIPGREAVEKAGISSQTDAGLDAVSAELYEKEFYGGVLLGIAEQFAEMRVSDAKDKIKKWMSESGYSDVMLELAGEVRCRCGAQCTVKLFTNQWFLNYSDGSWKDKGRKCLDTMSIIPEDIRGEFYNVIGWLRERACARQRGLGTKLPWDQDWIVESLADSVIYMSYYIVSKFVNSGEIEGGKLGPQFFDYVLLGRGGPDRVPNVPPDVLEKIRREFEYFYPVDARHSGRDLVPNHLTFFVLNHVATFPQRHWPKKIVVNGSVLGDGKKMSKSMGNIIPLRKAIREYGADSIRLAILISAELLQDAEFNFEAVMGIKSRLEGLLDDCARVGAMDDAGEPALHPVQLWMQSRTGSLVGRVTASIESMRLREALHSLLYEFESDLSWYLKRISAEGIESSGSHAAAMRHAYETRVILLCPFAPFAAEEMWQKLGQDGAASMVQWPAPPKDERRDAVFAEHMLRLVLDDIASILKVTKIKPNKITVYVADELKSKAYRTIAGKAVSGDISMKDVMRALMADPDTRDIKRRPDFVQKAIKDALSQPEEIRQAAADGAGAGLKEWLAGQLPALVQSEYGAAVSVYGEDEPDLYDPKNRAGQARPAKPALFVE